MEVVDDIIKEELAGLQNEDMVDVIEDVIRLRGGGIGMTLRSGKRIGYGMNRLFEVGKVAFRTAKRARMAPMSETITAVGDILGKLESIADVNPITQSEGALEVKENEPALPGPLKLRGGMDAVMGGNDTQVGANREIVKQFKFRKLMQTAYTYMCSPVAWTYQRGSTYQHQCAKGVGPCLYWVTDEDLASGSQPNPNFGKLRENVLANPGSNLDAFFGYNGPIYVFAADWFGNVMNHNVYTQTKLLWDDEPVTATNDPNAPIVLDDLVGVNNPNKDWTIIRHYATHLEFEFTNLAPYPYIVEILFFKWKVDPDDLDWVAQQLAPLSNQDQMHAYCENNIRNFGTEQIIVLKRHRQRVYGLENAVYIPTGATDAGHWMNIANSSKTNVGKYSFKVKHKYDVVKAIKVTGAEQGYTEADFFNKFYVKEMGVYCRMQAWPEAPLFTTAPSGTTTNCGYTRLNNIYDDACIPKSDAVQSYDLIRPGLQVLMKKRSYLKVDAPVLKGPFLRYN